MNTESKSYIISVVSRFFEKHNVSRREFSKAISIVTDTLNEIGYDPNSLTPHPDKADDIVSEVKATLAEW